MSTLHTLSRRPWYQVRVGVGNKGDARGRAWWAQTEDRARPELKRRLDEAVAWGARDVLIDSPMGRLPTSFVSGASWGPIAVVGKELVGVGDSGLPVAAVPRVHGFDHPRLRLA
jgi:hypothetical protein